MDRKEFYRLVMERPFLWLVLGSFYPARLNAIEEVAVSKDSPFHDFCERLHLPRTPQLFVIDDTAKNVPPGWKENFNGAYIQLSNSVFMTRTAYESMARGEDAGVYIAAHEAGHAASLQHKTRRHVLETGAVGLTYWAALKAKQWEHRKESEEGRPGVPVYSVVEPHLYGAALAYLLHSVFMRVEEFNADKYAKTVLPPERIITGVGEMLEAAYRSDKQEKKLAKLRERFETGLAAYEAARGAPLDDMQRKLSWATFLGEQSMPALQLPFMYPTGGERMARMRSSAMPIDYRVR